MSTYRAKSHTPKNSNYVGRAYIKVKYLKDQGMHIKRGKQGSTRKVLSHLQYIAYRSREQNPERDTYGVFSEKDRHANLNDFYKRIEEDKALRHSNTVKIHKMQIGFHREWYDKYGIDYVQLTRHVLKSLEEKKGIKLDWVAAHHLTEKSPHVHIAIKSVGIDQISLKPKRLQLTGEDIKYVRDEIDRYTGRDQVLEREKVLREQSKTNERDKGQEYNPKNFSPKSLLREVTQTIDQLSREGEHKNEQARDKLQRQEAQRERREQGRSDR